MIYAVGNGQMHQVQLQKTVGALNCMHDQQIILRGRESSMKSAVRRLTPVECERLQGYPDNWTLIGERAEDEIWKDENGNEYLFVVYKHRDSEGKLRKVSDSSRYRSLGNSICLPFWHWLLKRISAQYERPATLGSLFDGIGGFPLCHERINGPGTALWASEIDGFCIAVTSERFPEGDGDATGDA